MSTTSNQDNRIELKYALDEHLAEEVKFWAREQLGVDPHCCGTLGDSYDIHTLYLDTPQLDLYHRTGIAGSSKHRIRRYGSEDTLWLERKRKKNDFVKKSRTAVPEQEVYERFAGRAVADSAPWCGDWFAQRVAQRLLRPAIQVHYRRFARTTLLENENLRLTIDSHLQASRVSDWSDSLVAGSGQESPRLAIANIQILELKFHNHMPLLFKELLTKFPIMATGFSKYRTAVSASGLIAVEESSDVSCPSHGSPNELGAPSQPAEHQRTVDSHDFTAPVGYLGALS